MSRRQQRRDKVISGSCLQRQDSSKKLFSLMAPAQAALPMERTVPSKPQPQPASWEAVEGDTFFQG